jgi:hypothetical protein
MVKKFNGKTQLTASKAAPIAVIKEAPNCPQTLPICQFLLDLVKSEYRGDQSSIVASQPSRRALKISELQEFGNYFDFTGVV